MGSKNRTNIVFFKRFIIKLIDLLKGLILDDLDKKVYLIYRRQGIK